MPPGRREYLAAARHPWACVLFVLPLLAAYEVAVLALRPAQREACRNGADLWLRRVLGEAGLSQWFWAPLLLAVLLLAWAWRRRRDRPGELLTVWLGMTLESAVFAVGLWGGCKFLVPLLAGAAMQVPPASECDPGVQQVVSFVGAGIYEEMLFRLLLFSALTWLLRQAEFNGPGARSLSALLSALLFSLAHHIGAQGELFNAQVFLFRTVAGLYFAALYHFRGFGIAVGAHAGYDVLVGILLEM